MSERRRPRSSGASCPKTSLANAIRAAADPFVLGRERRRLIPGPKAVGYCAAPVLAAGKRLSRMCVSAKLALLYLSNKGQIEKSGTAALNAAIPDLGVRSPI